MNPNVAFEAQSETLTIVPADTDSRSAGVACPIHEVEIAGALSEALVRPAIVGEAAEPRGAAAATCVTTASIARASLPWALHRGDRVRRQRDGAIFEIKDILPEGAANLVLHLVPVDRLQ